MVTEQLRTKETLSGLGSLSASLRDLFLLLEMGISAPDHVRPELRCSGPEIDAKTAHASVFPALIYCILA